MANDTGITWTPASQKKFNALLNEMQQVTKKEMPTVLWATSKDFAFAALGFTPIAPATNPRTGAPIRNRGFAQQGWVWVLRELGVTNLRAKYDGGSNAARYMNKVINKSKADRGYILLSNMVPYINDLDRGSAHNPPAHIGSRAMTRTMQQMEFRLTLMAQRQGRAWRRVRVV